MNPLQMLYGSVVTCHGQAVQKVYLAEQFLNGDVTTPPHLRPNLPLVFPGFCLPIYQAAKFISVAGIILFSPSPQHQDVLQQDDEDEHQAGTHPHV